MKELTEGLDEKDVRNGFDSVEVLFQGVWVAEGEGELSQVFSEILKKAPDEGVKSVMFNLMYAADTSPEMGVFDDVLRVIAEKLNDANITWSLGESDNLDKGFFKVSMVGFGSDDV